MSTELVEARSRQLERLNDVLEADDLGAVLTEVASREERVIRAATSDADLGRNDVLKTMHALMLSWFDDGEIDDIRRRMSPEFRTISSLHDTA